MTTSINVCG